MKATVAFLGSLPLFKGVLPSQLKLVAEDFMPRRFTAGEVIFQEGDAGQTLYMVQSGQVRIFIISPEGAEMSVILCGRPGDLFGELAVIDSLPRSANAVAMEETIVYTMTQERFREHMRRTPQLALNFMKELSVRVRYNTHQVDSLTSLSVPNRLARKLLELAQDYGTAEADGVRIQTVLNQSDLASLIGATRESINKAMRLFRGQGWMAIRDGYIVILDADALREQGVC